MTQELKKYDSEQGQPQEFEILSLSQLRAKFQEKSIAPHRTEFFQIR
jgi:hypothetical protein